MRPGVLCVASCDGEHMKRLLISLKSKYGNPSAEDLISQFKLELENFDNFNVIKELLPKPEVIVEYPDHLTQKSYDLLDINIVECLSTGIPLE